MAGIYIHIPFCKTICSYCDFYKTAGVGSIDKTVLNIAKEIEIRKNYLKDKEVQTVYFGGGTPSLLDINNLKLLLSTVSTNFDIAKNAEITLEANPDDLNAQFLHDLKQNQIHRLSIGIQSFNNKDLEFLNRRHNSGQAVESVKLAQKMGFTNISIDLIYGLDFSSDEQFRANVQQAVNLGVQHISAYHLTIEEKTKFYKLFEKGELSIIDEERSNQQFQYLVKALKKSGFEHYEISNFAKKGYIAKHNTNYWKQIPYLGVGPSAHSFDGNTRQWNISNLMRYNKALDNGSLFFEKETLTETDKFNDYILTSLRTKWGIDLDFIKNYFDKKYYKHLKKQSKSFISNNILRKKKEIITVKPESIFLTDYICTELMFV